jgi:hypothetical protein
LSEGGSLVRVTQRQRRRQSLRRYLSTALDRPALQVGRYLQEHHDWRNVLTNGLIGKVDSNLVGYDGQWPDVTTIGLRNLSGLVNRDGTVTLWATTSTASASGDNGAAPNEVVRITDDVSATTVAARVAQEAFSTVAGPTYGTVYRGVTYVSSDCESEHHFGDDDSQDR